jgi:hypothetical protein
LAKFVRMSGGTGDRTPACVDEFVNPQRFTDRNAQFAHIYATAATFLQQRQPVISVDTKKKEIVGEFKSAGRSSRRRRRSTCRCNDFPTQAAGKAIPYGGATKPESASAVTTTSRRSPWPPSVNGG